MRVTWLDPGIAEVPRMGHAVVNPQYSVNEALTYFGANQAFYRDMSQRGIETGFRLHGAKSMMNMRWLEDAPRSRVRWLNRLGYGPPCASYTHYPVNATKPYLYVVQAGEGMSDIAKKFGHSAPMPAPPGGWGELRDANPNIPVVRLSDDQSSDQYNVCVLQINPGDQINIPASWPDPTGSNRGAVVCPDPSMQVDWTTGACVPKPGGPPPPPGGTCTSGSDCKSGQFCINGICTNTPFDKPASGCPTGTVEYHGKCYIGCGTQKLDPITGNCLPCPVNQKPDPKDPTKCISSVTKAGFGGDSGVLILALGALVALFAVGAGGKARAKRRAQSQSMALGRL